MSHAGVIRRLDTAENAVFEVDELPSIETALPRAGEITFQMSRKQISETPFQQTGHRNHE